MKRSAFILILLTTIFSGFCRETVPFNDGWQFKKPENLLQTTSDTWQQVDIPHTWNAEDMQVKKNIFYEGKAYYKKSFQPNDLWKDKRVFLRFEGVGATAKIYLNGTPAGNHEGAYSAFTVELTKLLKYNQMNELLVEADNASRPDVIPINQTLFGVYGGIYRPVSLIVTEKVHIAVNDYASSGVYLRQQNVSAKSADLTVKVKLENKQTATVPVRLITTIYETDGTIKARQTTPIQLSPQGRQTLEQHIRIAQPHLWQGLDDPYLYKTTVQIETDGKISDEVVQPLGLRRFELRREGMFLNGKKVPMYGVCRHQDWWQYGSALSNEQHNTDLDIIREIGATTIRFAHYQQAEQIYAKCDSIGFIVWAEIPFVNRVSTQEAGNAKQQLTELIRQNYNHPSIYVWGLHNEVYSPANYTIALTTELNDLAKTEDPDRYTVSVNGYATVNQAVNLNADIQGINRYFGWYEKTIDELENWANAIETQFHDYKIMLAEYGAEANINQQEEHPGEFGRYFSQFYPETFATKFHEKQWSIIAKHPFLLASYVWNTFDFATPINTQGGVEARNMKGLVTFDRKVKKDAFYWYKANWSKEPVLYLTQRRLTERKNALTDVTVYSNVGTPQITVNGVTITTATQGTTAVHYIFKDVALQEGDNIIIATVHHKGAQLSDTVRWHYTPENQPIVPEKSAGQRTQEHIGL
ncbi:MAG: beta-galactosidase [Candidatus Symbiothrix sp.]|nr:beta-galactosidase [Candidatus Symbiothrix sp.]